MSTLNKCLFIGNLTRSVILAKTGLDIATVTPTAVPNSALCIDLASRLVPNRAAAPAAVAAPAAGTAAVLSDGRETAAFRERVRAENSNK